MRARLGLALAAMALAGCGGQPARTRVRMAVVAQTLSQLPVYLARELGLFEQAGLEVSLEELPGSSKGLEALLGGSVEAAAGYYDLALQMTAEGRDIRSFLLIGRSPLVVLAAAPGSRIERIEDLKGSTVGVTTLGSNTHFFLNHLLRRHGLNPEDVQAVTIGTAARALAAMEQRRVQAGVVSDLVARTLEKRHGAVTLLADARTPSGLKQIYGVESYPSAVLYASGAWLGKHPDTARRLAGAVLQAMDWSRRQTPRTIRERMPVSYRGDDPAIYEEAIRGAVAMLSADGRIRPEEAEVVRRVQQVQVDLAATFTNSFAVRQ